MNKSEQLIATLQVQGVVLTDEELCSIRNQVACNEVRRDDDSRTICVKHGRALEAAVLARLNAAPVQQVSVPDGWKLVPVDPTCQMTLTGQKLRYDSVNSIGEIYRQMLAASPAAPAADAGLSLVEWTKDAEEWGGALNDAGWVFIEQCPETSALLFNNTKGPLRAAIMKYAEIVAANAKDSSHDQ